MIRWVLTSIALVLTLTVGGWGQVQAPVEPAFGGKLTIGVYTGQSFNMNPFRINSPFEQQILHLIYGRGLISSYKEATGVALRIERVRERDETRQDRFWRIRIRQGITFQNGTKLTNGDVGFTLLLLKKFGGAILNRPLDFSDIGDITLRGDSEVIIELTAPDNAFDKRLIDLPVLSESYYAEALSDGHEVFFEKRAMGMGPYELERKSEFTWEFRYNSSYFAGRPYLDDVVVRFFQNEQSMINALANEEVDFVQLDDRETAESLHNLMDDKLAFFKMPRRFQKVYVLLFNLRKKPLSSVAVRRALSMAVDRTGLVRKHATEIGQVANTLVGPSDDQYQKELYESTYNPLASLDILEQNGWRSASDVRILSKLGQQLSFQVFFNRFSKFEEKIVRSIKTNLAEIGVDARPTPLPINQQQRVLERGDYSAMLYAYEYDINYPFQAYANFYSDILGADRNPPNYQHTYLSPLFEWARDDRARREKIPERFQVFTQPDVPALFLFFDEQILVGVSRRFYGNRETFKQDKLDYYRLTPIEFWYVPKGLQR